MVNCFAVFCAEHRRKIAANCPSADVLSELGKLWKELPIKDKQHYKHLAAQINKKKKKNTYAQKIQIQKYQFAFKVKMIPKSKKTVVFSLDSCSYFKPETKIQPKTQEYDFKSMSPKIENLLN